MLRLIKYLILAPVAILLIAFAFANRHWVTVSFDPFVSGDDAAFSLSAPLFLVIVVSIMIGVIAGGVSTWFAQGRHSARAKAVPRRCGQVARRPASREGGANVFAARVAARLKARRSHALFHRR